MQLSPARITVKEKLKELYLPGSSFILKLDTSNIEYRYGRFTRYYSAPANITSTEFYGMVLSDIPNSILEESILNHPISISVMNGRELIVIIW